MVHILHGSVKKEVWGSHITWECEERGFGFIYEERGLGFEKKDFGFAYMGL